MILERSGNMSGYERFVLCAARGKYLRPYYLFCEQNTSFVVVEVFERGAGAFHNAYQWIFSDIDWYLSCLGDEPVDIA